MTTTGVDPVVAFACRATIDVPACFRKSRLFGAGGDIIHNPACKMAARLNSDGNSILLHQLKLK